MLVGIALALSSLLPIHSCQFLGQGTPNEFSGYSIMCGLFRQIGTTDRAGASKANSVELALQIINLLAFASIYSAGPVAGLAAGGRATARKSLLLTAAFLFALLTLARCILGFLKSAGGGVSPENGFDGDLETTVITPFLIAAALGWCMIRPTTRTLGLTLVGVAATAAWCFQVLIQARYNRPGAYVTFGCQFLLLLLVILECLATTARRRDFWKVLVFGVPPDRIRLQCCCGASDYARGGIESRRCPECGHEWGPVHNPAHDRSRERAWKTATEH